MDTIVSFYKKIKHQNKSLKALLCKLVWWWYSFGIQRHFIVIFVPHNIWFNANITLKKIQTVYDVKENQFCDIYTFNILVNVLYFNLFLSSLLSKYKSARDILILHGYMKTQLLQIFLWYQKSLLMMKMYPNHLNLKPTHFDLHLALSNIVKLIVTM